MIYFNEKLNNDLHQIILSLANFLVSNNSNINVKYENDMVDSEIYNSDDEIPLYINDTVELYIINIIKCQLYERNWTLRIVTNGYDCIIDFNFINNKRRSVINEFGNNKKIKFTQKKRSNDEMNDSTKRCRMY